MKARIHVTLKPGILDPQGKAIEHALSTLGYQSVSQVRVGKQIDLELDETVVPDAEAQVKAMCEKLLANTIIEEYAYELESDRLPPRESQRMERLIVLEDETEQESEPISQKPDKVVGTVKPPLASEAVPDTLSAIEEHTPWATASARAGQDGKAQEDARRLAKRILVDLALLNPRAVDEGVRSGKFRQVLKEDLDEGLALFRQQISESVRMQHDYFGEAVDEFINERRRSLGMI